MKYVLSNRVVLRASGELLTNITSELTHRITIKSFTKGNKFKTPVEYIRNYKILSTDKEGSIISIPRGRLDLVPEGLELVDKRILIPVDFPEAKFSPREDQRIIIDEIDDDCFVNAPVGFGKTFLSLHAAKKLGQKTLVVTHNTMLRDQWIKEVQSLFGIDPGIIGSGRFDTDSIITIGNIQSLVKSSLQLAKEFGTIILDEAHHCPATTFNSFIDHSAARYRIGLSATMSRKDGKHVLFRDFFSNKIYRPPQSNTLDPVVTLVKSGIHLENTESWAQKINALLYDDFYQLYVSSIAKDRINKGHSVLVIADRVEFLHGVARFLKDQCIAVTGATTLEERESIKELVNSDRLKCIAGSRSIFAEGISINRLSCVILATPISNESLLEQIIGRIMRMHEKKENMPPEVVDIQFSDAPSKRQNSLRLGFYLNKGWKVREEN